MTTQKKKVVIIIDGYKFSADFAASIRCFGLDAIHIFSTATPIAVMELATKFNRNDFINTFHFRGDLLELINSLQPYQIEAVIPATEPGVMLADSLAEALHCPGNGITHSQARRNKYIMLDTINKAGLPTPRFIKADNIESIRHWIGSNPYPIVLKPLSEAGTIGVHIIYNESQLETACQTLWQMDGILQVKETKDILAEEFLRGEEYAINTLSCQGQHFLIDVWKYYKVYTANGHCRYERTELQSNNFKQAGSLIDYTFSALNALNVKFGVSHCEIMLTSQGPRLIEIGTRVIGMSDKNFWNQCLGYNQVDLCVASYLKPKEYFSFLPAKKLYKNALVITLDNEKSGKILNLPPVDAMKNRKSYHNHYFNYQVNQMIYPTTSLVDSPGRIYLVHEDVKTIEDDYHFLKGYVKKTLEVEEL